jgi:RNA polymerase sigma-70 factor (ECF subfamily)
VSDSALDHLLEKLCRGDLEAAEQVFVTYEPYLRQVVRRQLPARLRTRFDSQDIVQSAWRDLLFGFRKAGWRFTNAVQLRAFLVKVTRNRFIDRCRQHHAVLDREEPLAEIASSDQPHALEAEPGDIVQAEELWERMLALCPAEHHGLLRLRRDGVPLPEIAARTGLHVGSVRRILRTLAIQLACEGARNEDQTQGTRKPIPRG